MQIEISQDLVNFIYRYTIGEIEVNKPYRNVFLEEVVNIFEPYISDDVIDLCKMFDTTNNDTARDNDLIVIPKKLEWNYSQMTLTYDNNLKLAIYPNSQAADFLKNCGSFHKVAISISVNGIGYNARYVED